MRIKKIQIKNFKSLVDFELNDLKPFCAFVGPNASGKSNIFEALEFINYIKTYRAGTFDFFKIDDIFSFLVEKVHSNPLQFQHVFDKGSPRDLKIYLRNDSKYDSPEISSNDLEQLSGEIIWDDEQFTGNFSRIFVGNSKLQRINSRSLSKLATDASNLSAIIGDIFQNDKKSNDFLEWTRIIIPEFSNIEVKKSNIDGSVEFFIYEKGSLNPFPKYLISDGTYNILALMAAVYQTDEPQFLCIEEPENGLHPQAIELLVDFFREKCEEKGHHIWLNTHSQTLVRCMEIDEIILVNKINGQTKAKQLTKTDKIDIRTDEAWLSNALGGGVL